MQAVVVLTVTGALSQLIGFVYRILLTRMAGAEILGLYQLILPVYSVLLSLTLVGLTTAVSNLSARYEALGNRRAIDGLRSQAVWLFFCLSILPCCLLTLGSDAASVLLLGDARTQLGLILLPPCLLLTGIENIQKNYFYGTGRVIPAALTDLTEHLLRAVLILGLLFYVKPPTAERAVGTIVFGMLLCEIFSAVTQTLLFRHYLGARRLLPGAGVPPVALRRVIYQIGVPVGLSAVLGNLISSVNAILIPRLLVQGGMEQGEAVSAYGVTFGMTLPMLLLPTAFLSALGLVLAPKLSRAAALGRRTEIRRQVQKSVAMANLILIPSLALLAVLGSAIGGALYGESTVGENLPILALGVLFSCWQTLFACVLNALNRQTIYAVLAFISDVIELLLTCLTVGRWGIAGYAVSFVVSTLLGAVWSWQVVSRETELRLPVFRWFTAPMLAACLASACAHLMDRVLLRDGASQLPAACAALGLGILLYLSALQAMGVLVRKKEDVSRETS